MKAQVIGGSMLHRSSSFRTIALLGIVTVLLSACTSWYPMSLEPRGLPDKVRITTESERVELWSAGFVGDTAIAGSVKGRNRRSIRLVDMQALEGGSFNFQRTVLAVVGIPFLLAAALTAAAVSRRGAGRPSTAR